MFARWSKELLNDRISVVCFMSRNRKETLCKRKSMNALYKGYARNAETNQFELDVCVTLRI